MSPADYLMGLIASLTEAGPIAGGCADCSADQTMRTVAPGVFVLSVAHDPGCPAMAAREVAE